MHGWKKSKNFLGILQDPFILFSLIDGQNFIWVRILLRGPLEIKNCSIVCTTVLDVQQMRASTFHDKKYVGYNFTHSILKQRTITPFVDNRT